jgi:hypothetical protein
VWNERELSVVWEMAGLSNDKWGKNRRKYAALYEGCIIEIRLKETSQSRIDE